MARRIANGVQLTRQCWRALRQNRQLLLFPLLSAIAILLLSSVLLVSIGGVMFYNNGELPMQDDSRWIEIMASGAAFVYCFVCYTITIFSNTALVGASLKLLRGEPATVSDGFYIATRRLNQIFGFALVSAIIGTLAQAGKKGKREGNSVLMNVLSAIAGGWVGKVWSITVFFVIPVYIAENLGPIAAIRRSWEIFKRTWGEGFTGRAVIGGVGCLVYLGIFGLMMGLMAIAVSLASFPLACLAMLFGIGGLFAIALVTGAINGVFQASLYHYATTGNAGRFIDNDLARNAFPQ